MKKKIKKFALAVLLFLSFSSVSSVAQTTLAAGDIAFSGYIGGFSSPVPDEFSFVLLKNVTSGTVINFTDNSWLHTNSFRTGEQNITWTATSALSAGQEIHIAGLTATIASGPGLPGNVTGTPLSLATSGDQVIAFQGTIASPTFISGIHMNVYTIAVGNTVDTNAAVWDGTASNDATASSLPTGLTTGMNAIWVGVFQVSSSESDNARFTCGSANISTVATTRAALNNPANWTKSNNAPVGFTLPTGCPYLVVSAANVSISGRALTAEGYGISKASVSLIDSKGNIQNSLTSPFGYYRFDELQAGETYILQISSKRYQFDPPTRIVSPKDNLSEVDFAALP